MATYIEAFVAYGPRLLRRPTVRMEELSRRLTGATSLRSGEVRRVLDELADAILDYGSRGAGVELEGIGTFRPGLKGDGQLQILYRPDRRLIGEFDNLGAYKGQIENRENIGLSPEGYKALWDADHPDDPLELAGIVEAAA